MALSQSSIARLMCSNAARAVPMMWLDVLATAVVNQTLIVYRGAEFTTWLLLMSLMDIGYLPWRQRHVDCSAVSRLTEACLCYTVQWAAFRLILYPLHGIATVATLSLFCLPTPVAVRWMPLLSVVPPAITYIGYAAYKKKLHGDVPDATLHFPEVQPGTSMVPPVEGTVVPPLGGADRSVSNLRNAGVEYASVLSRQCMTLATTTVQLVPRRLGLLRRLLPKNIFQSTSVVKQCDDEKTNLDMHSDDINVPAAPTDKSVNEQTSPNEQTVQAPLARVESESRANYQVASQSYRLMSNINIPGGFAHSFQSAVSAEISSSRSSETLSRASSSDSTSQLPSATVSMLNTILANSHNFLPPDNLTTYAMGVPLGFGSLIKSEANPRLILSPIARTAMEHMRLYSDNDWLTHSQHYYVERLGAFNKIWRLLQSLK